MDENNAVSVVEALIETCKDGQKGYQDAASHAKRSELKAYFNEQAMERGRFAQELQAELPKLGERARKSRGPRPGPCTVPGSIRKWPWAPAISQFLNR